MRVAVTGANGFVGKAVTAALLAHGHQVVALTRAPDASLALPGVEAIATGAIEAIRDWRPFLANTDAVVHLAARAHVDDAAFADGDLVRAINTTATLRLAESAAQRGAQRFLFLSSIKVLGEATPYGAASRPFKADDPLAPADLYARSKAEAERGLEEIATHTGLPITILRPPLVHGPGVRANFRRLVELVAKVPVLPFGAIDNRRSVVSVDNLAAAILACLTHPAAAGRRFLVSDSEDLSTPELVRLIADAMGRSVWLAPVPVPLMILAGRLTGREALIRRLTDSLQLDPSALVFDLGWRPVETLSAGIAKTVRWCMAQKTGPKNL